MYLIMLKMIYWFIFGISFCHLWLFLWVFELMVNNNFIYGILIWIYSILPYIFLGIQTCKNEETWFSPNYSYRKNPTATDRKLSFLFFLFPVVLVHLVEFFFLFMKGIV
jgi:hypothetical protein